MLSITTKANETEEELAKQCNEKIEKIVDSGNYYLDNLQVIGNETSKALISMRPSLLTFETGSTPMCTGHGYFVQEVWKDENGKIVRYGDFWQHADKEDWFMGTGDRKMWWRVPLPAEVEFEQLCQVGLRSLIAIPRKGQSIVLDKTLYVYGSAANGRLGTGNTTDLRQFTPIQIKEKGNQKKVKSILKVFCPDSNNLKVTVYAIALMEDNTKSLFGCGGNEFGGLGLEHKNQVLEWTLIMDNIKNVHCPSYEAVIVEKDTGEYVAAGANCIYMNGTGSNIENDPTFKPLTVQPAPDSKFSGFCVWATNGGQWKNFRAFNS